jgi:hypothetical protein
LSLETGLANLESLRKMTLDARKIMCETVATKIKPTSN